MPIMRLVSPRQSQEANGVIGLDILDMAKAGDPAAMDAIARKFYPAAKLYAKSLLRWIPLDEAISVTNYGLALAIKTFDPSRGFQFSTYAMTCMSNAAKTFATKQSTAKAKVRYVSHETLHTYLDRGITEPYIHHSTRDAMTVCDDGHQQMEAQSLAKAIAGMLTEDERKAMARVVDGDTYAAIAKAMSISEAKAARVVKQARAKAMIAFYASGHACPM